MLSPGQRVINLPWAYFALTSVRAAKQSISKICEDQSRAEINIMLLALSMGSSVKNVTEQQTEMCPA